MQGEETPTWWAAPFKTPLDVNWRQEGDEWLHHLWVALAEEVKITGHGASTQEASPEFPTSHLVFVPTSTQLKSQLRLVPLERGILVVITGTDSPETADPDQIQPWVTAIEQASSRVGKRHESFAWLAVVGTLSGMESTNAVLASEANVASLHLTPAPHHLTEYAENPAQPSLFGRAVSWSWPITVEGASIGYNWPAASTEASRNVHRLAALLTLAWDGCWVLRQAPVARREAGTLEIPSRPWWDARLENEPPEDNQTLGFESQPVPQWLDQAWAILDADPIIEDALVVYHEGRVLQQQGHESFAMVAFVASIEAAGAKLPDATGSVDRFRRALALVVADEGERNALVRMAYGRRSRTAHAGKLFGTEAAPGTLVTAGFLSERTTLRLTINVYTTRKAAHDLLLRILRDGLMLST